MNTSTQARGFRVWAISLVAAGFGLLTIREGSAVLFGAWRWLLRIKPTMPQGAR